MKDIYQETDVDASDILEHNMSKYVTFTIGAFFPSCYDGLMKVHQRIIEAIKKYKVGTSKKLSQWGGVINDTHPHGEGSIHQSMARLMQPFRHQIPLLEDQGDCGTYESPFGAQPRYLEASASKFLTDIYFDVEPTALYYRLSDAGNEMEPEYYIPKIPMALHLGTTGIATAFKTIILPRDINDVCDIAIWYIDRVIEGKDAWLFSNSFPTEVAHLLLHHFPIKNNILNEEQLIQAYSKGDYTHQIAIEGNYEVNQNSITIKNLPFNTTYRKVADDFLSKLRKKDKSIREIQDALDTFRDLSDGKMRVDFKLIFKKRYNVWEFLPKIQKEFKLYKKMTSEPRFLIRDSNQKLGPGQLLSLWYRERLRAIMIKHHKEQDRLIKLLHIKEAQLILKDHIDEATEIFKSSKNKQDLIQRLVQRFDISYFQGEKLSELQLASLVQEERDNILVDIDNLRNKIKELTDALLDIPNLMKKEILDVKNKYGKVERLTRYPKYRGYVCVDGNNFVQLGKLEEAIKQYDFTNFSIRLDPVIANKYRYRINEYGKIDSDRPILFEKYFTSSYFVSSPFQAKYTVVINKGEETPTIFYVEGLYHPADDKKDFILTGDRLTTITSNGTVNCIDVKSLPLRKSINATGNMTKVIHLSNQAWDKMIIFYGNKKDPNLLRASVIENGEGKLKLLSPSDNHFYIFPLVADSIIFQPNQELFNRIPNYHLYIPNLLEFIGEAKNTIIDLSKRTVKHDKKANIQFLNLAK